MSGRKGFRIAVHVLRTVILSIALIILVLVGPLYLYRTVKNIQVKRLAREYLMNTYDFRWKFRKVEYYTPLGTMFVEVFPEDVRGVEKFEIYVYEEVIADTFIKEYVQICLEELLESDFKEIWGEENKNVLQILWRKNKRPGEILFRM